ncbi:MAG: hypothetical protein U1C55_10010 [Smithellaceae bacterium]|nr:hypothetical protein [Smithellaceae bacterium]
MGTLEILALIVILISIVKLVFVFVDLRSWLGFTRRLYAKPTRIALISLVLAVFVLFLLILSGLTIVQILAVCLFFVLLVAAGFAPYYTKILDLFGDLDLTAAMKNQWHYLALWIILMGWGLVEILRTAGG